MRKLINDSLIIKPREKPYEIRDTRLTGFLLRVQPTGSATYYMEYERGKRVKIGKATQIKAADARKEAKRIFRNPPIKQTIEEKRSQITFKDFLDNHHKPWLKSNVKAHKPTIKRLEFNFSHLHGTPLSQISVLDIEEWAQTRRPTTKPSTLNRALNDLSSLFSNAVKWEFVDQNPVRKVNRHKVDNLAVVRYLTDDEEETIRNALRQRDERLIDKRESGNLWREERDYDLKPSLIKGLPADHLTPMVILTLNTGLRRGELLALRWEDIDLDMNVLTVQGTTAKSGRTRHIPLNSEALDMFDQWQRQTNTTTGHVFLSRYGKPLTTIQKGWEAFLKETDITNLRWHDLRHSFASKLVMKGVELNTVRELLGHSDYKMTLRYAHLAPEHKAKAVEKLCE